MGKPVAQLLSLVVLAAVAGCGRERAPAHTGDLEAMRQRGVLRVLVPRLEDVDGLPRRVDLLDRERELADSLARTLGLEPRWIVVARRSDLIAGLEQGRGDLAAANLTATPERTSRIPFSHPLAVAREQVITRGDAAPISGAADLVGRTVVVRRSSSFWRSIESLQAEYPGIRLLAAPETQDTEEILYRVSRGEYDVTVADDNLVADVLGYMPELMVAFTLGSERPIAWGVRPGAPRLLAAVDSFLDRVRVTPQYSPYTGDLSVIKEHKVLRLLTRNSAATYFVWRGELVGFEYDLARELANRLGVGLEVVVPPTRAALLTWLRQGRGDIVAAGLNPTAERERRGVAFSRPYDYERQVLVGRAADSMLTTRDGLAGRTVVVRRSSSYWDAIERLRRGDRGEGVDVTLVPAPEELETEAILDSVASGSYDLTVADSHLLAIERSRSEDLRELFPVSDSLPHAWAVRAEDVALRKAIDDFFTREYRGLFYNLTYDKYFGNERRINSHVEQRTSRTGQVSPFDGIIRKYAGEYSFDWRLIAAQMFEESRFDPRARSFAGALGLMQVLPRTAEGFGVRGPSLVDPDTGTYAGVMYLAHVEQLVTGAATPDDRLWFTLASYNAGWGHVEDARRLAVRLGVDPDVWFHEVETIMPLLARAKYHRTSRHGYCRCSEPVRYVRRIRERQRAYRMVTAAGDSAAGSERSGR